MSKQRGKKIAIGRGPLVAGATSHGTTGTMVNLALSFGKKNTKKMKT